MSTIVLLDAFVLKMLRMIIVSSGIKNNMHILSLFRKVFDNLFGTRDFYGLFKVTIDNEKNYLESRSVKRSN